MAEVANTLPCVPAANTEMEAISTMISVVHRKSKSDYGSLRNSWCELL